MADLDPLIRYRKYGVDEKQRLLAQLYREADELAQKKQQIQEQMMKETALAEEMGGAETLAYLGRYLEGARTKIRGLEAAISKMEVRIELAREEMRVAFAEMKKVDIVNENRKKEEAAEIKAKEEQELAEVAIDQYRRHLEGEEDSSE